MGLALLLTVAAGSALWFADTGQVADTSPEYRVVQLVNDKRVSLGLRRLQRGPYLAIYSEWRSRVMRFNDSLLPHDACYLCGEVLGVTFTSPFSIFNAWMHSPTHRHILLLPGITKIGCGRVVDVRGARWWTCEVRY